MCFSGLGSYSSLAAAALLQLLLSRDQLLWLPWGCSVSQAPGQGDGEGVITNLVTAVLCSNDCV